MYPEEICQPELTGARRVSGGKSSLPDYAHGHPEEECQLTLTDTRRIGRGEEYSPARLSVKSQIYLL